VLQRGPGGRQRRSLKNRALLVAPNAAVAPVPFRAVLVTLTHEAG